MKTVSENYREVENTGMVQLVVNTKDVNMQKTTGMVLVGGISVQPTKDVNMYNENCQWKYREVDDADMVSVCGISVLTY